MKREKDGKIMAEEQKDCLEYPSFIILYQSKKH